MTSRIKTIVACATFSLVTLNTFAHDEFDYTDLDLPHNDWVAEEMTTFMNDWMNEYPEFSDEEYEQRLLEMSGAIDYRLDPMVKDVILMRVEKYRSSTERILGLSNVYFPIFEEHLAKHNVPHHLKYLPIVESRLEPVAKSYAGAVGLWQFITSTGKLYNLEISSTMDQRRDTYLASDAAATLLSDLYDIYGDWALALAAYNCGPGRVNRAVKSAGGSKNYWEVRKYLPTETQKYVPYFMAFAYVGEFYYLHDLAPVDQPTDLVLTDTIMLSGSKRLSDLAKEVDVHIDTVRKLNPAYLKGYVPDRTNDHAIVLPCRAVAKLRGYEARYQELLAYQTENPIRAIRRVSHKSEVEAYAKVFRCSMNDILYWNDLKLEHEFQEGEVIAIRQYRAPADFDPAPRRYFETARMPALQVTSIEGDEMELTTVYATVNPSAQPQPSQYLARNVQAAAVIDLTEPEMESTDIVMSSETANLPTVAAAPVLAARSDDDGQMDVKSVQKLDTDVNAQIFGRSRGRKIRNGGVNNQPVKIVQTTPPPATTAPTNTTSARMAEQHRQQLLEQAQERANLLQAKEQERIEDERAEQQAKANVGVVDDNFVAPATAPAPIKAESSTSNSRNLRHTKTTRSMPSGENVIYYTVQAGNTLSGIAESYPGVTVGEIMELNNFMHGSECKEGMTIMIPKK